MTTTTVTITQTQPATVTVTYRTALGRLFDTMRRSGLFEEVNDFERSISEKTTTRERDFALAWFYKNVVLTKDPEQALDVSACFEEVLGPELENLLDEVEFREKAIALKRYLQTQVELGEAAQTALRTSTIAMRDRVIQHVDDSDAASATLRDACQAAGEQVRALRTRVGSSREVAISQLGQWAEIAEECKRIGDNI